MYLNIIKRRFCLNLLRVLDIPYTPLRNIYVYNIKQHIKYQCLRTFTLICELVVTIRVVLPVLRTMTFFMDINFTIENSHSFILILLIMHMQNKSGTINILPQIYLKSNKMLIIQCTIMFLQVFDRHVMINYSSIFSKEYFKAEITILIKL